MNQHARTNRMHCITWLIAGLSVIASGRVAQADLVTAIPGGTVYTFAGINTFGPGPETVAPGITWSSTNAANQGGSIYGYTNAYGFLDNGYWDGGLGPMVGLNDSFAYYGVSDTMTFSFATPVAAVGGFLNYVPGGPTQTTIAVYNSSNVLIESDNLTFTTGGGDDTGLFLGFQESSNDISSFTLTDNYIGIVGLTTSSIVTPEPGVYAVLSIAVLGLVFVARRRRTAPAERDCSKSWA